MLCGRRDRALQSCPLKTGGVSTTCWLLSIHPQQELSHSQGSFRFSNVSDQKLWARFTTSCKIKRKGFLCFIQIDLQVISYNEQLGTDLLKDQPGN